MRSIQFFASLRRMFAYQRAIDSMGSIVHQAIKEHFIPKLELAIKAATLNGDAMEVERLEKMLDMYETYSDPNTPESKVFGQSAAKVVRGLSRTHRMDEEGVDEIAQMVSVRFYTGNALSAFISKIDPTIKSPIDVNKIWMRYVDLWTRDQLRTLVIHQKDVFKREEEMGEDGIKPLDRLEAPKQVSESELRDYEKMMVDYVHKHAKDDVTRKMFDIWWEVAQEKGADRVRMDNDVFPVLMDEGFQVGRSTLNSRHLELKRLLNNFFKSELDYKMSDAARSRLHISSVEVLTEETFRRKFAAWVLGLA